MIDIVSVVLLGVCYAEGASTIGYLRGRRFQRR